MLDYLRRMPPFADPQAELLSKAATCRRIAADMDDDPLRVSLIEIAEGYEELAAKGWMEVILAPHQPG